jgi:hypothetical protein
VLKDSHNSEIIVTVNRGQPDERRLTFCDSFRIGRGNSCEVRLQEPVVSTHHVEVLYENGTWWIHDVHSTNGTFLDGELIHKALLKNRATIQLGKGGPIVSFKIKDNQVKEASFGNHSFMGTKLQPLPFTTQIYQKYFSKAIPRSAGQYTVVLRKALNAALKKRAKKFLLLLGIVSIVAISALIIVWLQHDRLTKLEPLATDIFYSMKSLELQIAALVQTLPESANHEQSRNLSNMRSKYQELQREYDRFVDQLGVYNAKINREERIILRVARIFGECEINAPVDFVKEVNKYIKKWQSSSRLQRAIQRSLSYGYNEIIAKELLANDLPPQYFYLALQESDFDVNQCGPKTRYGIAKGMWQFIPATAAAYGLKLGPLRELQRPDPRDERHDFSKSTKAAARFIRDMYNTKAQGSGLLVLASYNWGIGNLQEIIDKMPPNPRERNFWQLVKNHKIPKQTYDFVFYIISAAVIGENPALFGFNFKNPLAESG